MSTEQKHTPEPWRLEPRIGPDAPHPFYISACSRNPRVHGSAGAIAKIPHSKFHDIEANAYRIVACVNYCAGMTDDQLTCDSAQIVREELDRVVEQRDRLLAVLIEVRDNVREDSPEMWARVDAAIAGLETAQNTRYFVQVSGQPQQDFATTKEAIDFAARHVYLPWERAQDGEELLRRGAVFSFSYGFSEAHIIQKAVTAESRS